VGTKVIIGDSPFDPH